jgi:arginase family enzyme
MGPSALRYADLEERLVSLGYAVNDLGNVQTAEQEATALHDETARYLPEILAACAQIAVLVRKAVEAGSVPLVLGGDHSVALGTLGGLAKAHGGPGGVVWLDAHGDLNTVESSPTGNLWATPLRLLVDSGAVVAEDVALVGARNLDPPELEFMAAHGIDDDLGRALAGVDRVYVAVDTDVLRPGELAMFMPEPGGPTLDEVEATLRRVAALAPVAGAGITAFLDDPANQAALARLAAAALQPVTR